MTESIKRIDLDALESNLDRHALRAPFSTALVALIAEARASRMQIANLEVRNADLRERLFEADRARDKDEERAAMLERVVEAARSYADVASHAGAEPWALRAAINAADALRLTETASDDKGKNG